MAKKGSAEDMIRDIRRKSRRKHSAEEKIRICMSSAILDRKSEELKETMSLVYTNQVTD